MSEFKDYVEDLKDRLDIAMIAQNLGIISDTNGKTNCFRGHDQKTPSLQFYPESQRYYCFGCGAKGDVIALVQEVLGHSFLEAVNYLALQAGLQPWANHNGFDPELFSKVSECLNAASEIYHGWLNPDDEYLRSRGISHRTAQLFSIGHTRGRDDLKRELLARGLSPDIIQHSGLLNHAGDDFFQDHLIVPITLNGRVVDLYGRAMNEQAVQRHWRLGKDRLIVGDGLFNWNRRAEEIILVEGVLDALSLIENGISGGVAVFGTQGLKEKYINRLRKSRIQRVYVCYDGDAAGSQAAMRDADVLEAMGLEVKIIALPEDEDPNSLMLKNSADDFRRLLETASRPFDAEMSQIATLQVREVQLKAVRDQLLPRVKKADPIMQPDLLKSISRKFEIKLTALKDQLKRVPAEVHPDHDAGPVETVTDLREVNPALDIVDGTVIMLAPQQIRDIPGSPPRWQNTVVTSNRERFVLEPGELMNRGWYAPALEKMDVRVAEARYSSDVMDGFLAGHLQGNIRETYEKIRSTMTRYLDYSDDPTYDFVTCWAMGTYVHVAFSHYPYIHFTGPKGSGKSQCLHFLEAVCHNAKTAGSMTLAVQFRLIGALQPTVLFDEMENLGQTQHTELHRMIKYGFERNGPQVWRMEAQGKKMEMKSWSVYCPRAFAAIEGMEDVIGSRSVQIIMERSFNDDIKERTVNLEDPIWQELRDQLFLVTMTDGARIKEIYAAMTKPPRINFSGRDWDIFKGVLAVAKAVGDDVAERIIDFALAAHESRVIADQDNSPDIIILKYLSERVLHPDWYELGQLNQGLTEMASTQGLDLQGPMTRDRLGKRLKALKIYEETKRGVTNGKKVTLYRMEPDTIVKKLENYLRG